MRKSQELINIEEALRSAAEAVRRRDPDTLAGRVGSPRPVEAPPVSGKVKATSKSLR